MFKQPKKFKSLIWTDTQKRYVLRNAGKTSIELIAKNLGKTVGSIRTQIPKMGLSIECKK